MITRITFNLTDDERRAISGRRRPATRKEITEFVQRFVADALRRGPKVAAMDVQDAIAATPMLNCTTLDHLYPLGPKTTDTQCYCGAKKWGAFTPGGGIVMAIMSSRGNAPSLAISGIPPDVLKKALERAKRDGWFSKNALWIELLRDYGDGAIAPRAAPPPFDPARAPKR